jgi:hypothetical protein
VPYLWSNVSSKASDEGHPARHGRLDGRSKDVASSQLNGCEQWRVPQELHNGIDLSS